MDASRRHRCSSMLVDMRASDRVGGWYLRTSAKVALAMLVLLLGIFIVAFILK